MSMRVLVAEDDRRIAAFLVKGLREEGYVVEHVSDGITALDYISASTEAPFDLIILDILMPGRDGLSVCRELRTRGDLTLAIRQDQMRSALQTLEARMDATVGTRMRESGSIDFGAAPDADGEGG